MERARAGANTLIASIRWGGMEDLAMRYSKAYLLATQNSARQPPIDPQVAPVPTKLTLYIGSRGENNEIICCTVTVGCAGLLSARHACTTLCELGSNRYPIELRLRRPGIRSNITEKILELQRIEEFREHTFQPSKNQQKVRRDLSCRLAPRNWAPAVSRQPFLTAGRLVELPCRILCPKNWQRTNSF
eukprot:9498879-Pyramimonas_sp.AAC.1